MAINDVLDQPLPYLPWVPRFTLFQGNRRGPRISRQWMIKHLRSEPLRPGQIVTVQRADGHLCEVKVLYEVPFVNPNEKTRYAFESLDSAADVLATFAGPTRHASPSWDEFLGETTTTDIDPE